MKRHYKLKINKIKKLSKKLIKKIITIKTISMIYIIIKTLSKNIIIDKKSNKNKNKNKNKNIQINYKSNLIKSIKSIKSVKNLILIKINKNLPYYPRHRKNQPEH